MTEAEVSESHQFSAPQAIHCCRQCEPNMLTADVPSDADGYWQHKTAGSKNICMYISK